MSDKIYLPKCYARARETNFGEVINIVCDAAMLIEFIKANTTPKCEFKITVARRQFKSDKGLTHAVYLDTFQPDVKRATTQMRAAVNAVNAIHPSLTDTSDVPF